MIDVTFANYFCYSLESFMSYKNPPALTITGRVYNLNLDFLKNFNKGCLTDKSGKEFFMTNRYKQHLL